MTKRGHNTGAIDMRAEGVYRLRFRANGKRCTVTVRGSMGEARRKLRELLHSADRGEQSRPPASRSVHGRSNGWRCSPVATTGAVWSMPEQERGTPNCSGSTFCRPLASGHCSRSRRRKSTVSTSRLRAGGFRPAPCGMCTSRCALAWQAPYARACSLAIRPTMPTFRDRRTDAAQALDPAELKRLLDGFKGSVLYVPVCTAAFTGVRLGELLALRWADLDPAAKTLKIERTVETTAAYRRQTKLPKSRRGLRQIIVDDALLALLLTEREKYLRLAAGVPDGVQVDLSLVKLSPGALMFPAPPMAGEPFDFARLRNAALP